MATKNLGLYTLQGSDPVDYSVLNKWMENIDRLGVEYVTKYGKNGDWWYRIWSSGRCECGVDNRTKFESLTLNRPYIPNLYIPAGRVRPFGDYPVNFLAGTRPYATICFNYCNQDASCIIIQSSTAGETQTPEFVIANSQAITLTGVQLSIFCTGNASGAKG